jgi:hypothetical protein
MSTFRVCLVAGALATGLRAGPVHAADGQGRFVPKGIGRISCAEFSKILSEKKQPEIESMISWIAGYFTALNATSPDTFDLIPWQNENVMAELIARVCANNPQENFTNAVQQLASAFRPSRLAAREEPIEMKSGDNKARVHPSTIRESQATLIKLGLLTGSPDGSFGPKTKTAIEKFQEQAKIPKTGILDTDTLFALFLVKANQQG